MNPEPQPLQMCTLCGKVLARPDYPQVPLCGVHRTDFIQSEFFEKMFAEGGKRPGTTLALRAKWRALFVESRRGR